MATSSPRQLQFGIVLQLPFEKLDMESDKSAFCGFIEGSIRGGHSPNFEGIRVAIKAREKIEPICTSGPIIINEARGRIILRIPVEELTDAEKANLCDLVGVQVEVEDRMIGSMGSFEQSCNERIEFAELE